MLDIKKIEHEADIQVTEKGIKRDTTEGWYRLIYEPAVLYGILAQVGAEVRDEDHKAGFEECQKLMLGILRDRIKCYTDMRWSKKAHCMVSPEVVLDKESKGNMEETLEAAKTTLLESLPLVIEDGKGEDYDRILKDTKELLVEFKELNDKHLLVIRQIYGINKQPKGEKIEETFLKYTGTPNINTLGYQGNIKTPGQNKEDR